MRRGKQSLCLLEQTRRLTSIWHSHHLRTQHRVRPVFDLQLADLVGVKFSVLWKTPPRQSFGTA